METEVAIFKDWEDSSRGVIGLNLNSFLDYEGNIIKSFPRPEVKQEPYVPLDTVKGKLEGIQKSTSKTAEVIQQIQLQLVRNEEEKRKAVESTFSDFKTLSSKCITYFKTNLEKVQEKYKKQKEIEDSLRNQLNDLKSIKENIVLERDQLLKESNKLGIVEKIIDAKNEEIFELKVKLKEASERNVTSFQKDLGHPTPLENGSQNTNIEPRAVKTKIVSTESEMKKLIIEKDLEIEHLKNKLRAEGNTVHDQGIESNEIAQSIGLETVSVKEDESKPKTEILAEVSKSGFDAHSTEINESQSEKAMGILKEEGEDPIIQAVDTAKDGNIKEELENERKRRETLQIRMKTIQEKSNQLRKLLLKGGESLEKFKKVELDIKKARRRIISKTELVKLEKAKIRSWMDDFIQKNGNPPQKKDLLKAKPMYDSLKQKEKEVSESKASLVSLLGEQNQLFDFEEAEILENEDESNVSVSTKSTEEMKETPDKKQEQKATNNKAQVNTKINKGVNDNQSSKKYFEKAKSLEKKIKEVEGKLREARAKSNRLEKELASAEKSSKTSSGKNDDSVKIRRELENLKKSHAKETLELQKQSEKTTRKMHSQVEHLEKERTEMAAKIEQILKEKNDTREELDQLRLSSKDNEELRTELGKLKNADKQLKQLEKKNKQVEEMYKEEQSLRKKYFNMIEDMKGKIRVYLRCRPMMKYEIEKKSKEIVSYPDETTVEVKKDETIKSFVYDKCFTSASTQEEVFEETRNLIYSSLDGYNVCVFAYGQTGSGKTWTVVGSEDNPGLVRRTITELFEYREQNKDKKDVAIKLYMVELYQDNLYDLLRSNPGKKVLPGEKQQKLEIKKDKKGTVFVKGAIQKEVKSAKELMDLFVQANSTRKVASTNMNAGSSRSHLVFSLVIENKDLATNKVSIGKISLIDLAGSERSDKTGATGERIKEANSINKSLSALADVISALSTGEDFIPYRNNKLTQLMSDSLGGNAKTLMFVNISPADYNDDETLNSLSYASRVKLIKNNAEKSNESGEINKLQKIIKELKESGGTSQLLELYENESSSKE